MKLQRLLPLLLGTALPSGCNLCEFSHEPVASAPAAEAEAVATDREALEELWGKVVETSGPDEPEGEQVAATSAGRTQ